MTFTSSGVVPAGFVAPLLEVLVVVVVVVGVVVVVEGGGVFTAASPTT